MTAPATSNTVPRGRAIRRDRLLRGAFFGTAAVLPAFGAWNPASTVRAVAVLPWGVGGWTFGHDVRAEILGIVLDGSMAWVALFAIPAFFILIGIALGRGEPGWHRRSPLGTVDGSSGKEEGRP